MELIGVSALLIDPGGANVEYVNNLPNQGPAANFPRVTAVIPL
jgi:hypothetical protein